MIIPSTFFGVSESFEAASYDQQLSSFLKLSKLFEVIPHPPHPALICDSMIFSNSSCLCFLFRVVVLESRPTDNPTALSNLYILAGHENSYWASLFSTCCSLWEKTPDFEFQDVMSWETSGWKKNKKKRFYVTDQDPQVTSSVWIHEQP